MLSYLLEVNGRGKTYPLDDIWRPNSRMSIVLHPVGERTGESISVQLIPGIEVGRVRDLRVDTTARRSEGVVSIFGVNDIGVREVAINDLPRFSPGVARQERECESSSNRHSVCVFMVRASEKYQKI